MKKFLLILLPFILISCGDSSSSSDDKIGVTAYLKITSSLDASMVGTKYKLATDKLLTVRLTTCLGRDDNSTLYLNTEAKQVGDDAYVEMWPRYWGDSSTNIWTGRITVRATEYLRAVSKMDAVLCDYLKNRPEVSYDGMLDL